MPQERACLDNSSDTPQPNLVSTHQILMIADTRLQILGVCSNMDWCFQPHFIYIVVIHIDIND